MGYSRNLTSPPFPTLPGHTHGKPNFPTTLFHTAGPRAAPRVSEQTDPPGFPFTAAQTRTVYAHDMTAYSAAHARHTVPTSLASVDARGGPWGDGSLLGAILDPQNEMFTGGDGS